MALTSSKTDREFTKFREASGTDTKIAVSVEQSSEVPIPIRLGGKDQLDAVGKLRITNSTVLFSGKFSDSANDFDWAQKLVSGGSIVYNMPLAKKQLLVDTTATSQASLRSKRYIQYLPGRSFVATFVTEFAAPKANVIQESGVFDEQDGVLFVTNGTTQNIAVRSSTTGSPVDTLVPRSLWNMDRFDGAGPSGLTLDLTIPQVFVIDYAWYGYGKIRFGVLTNGSFNYCHEVSNVNISRPYNQRGSLPYSFTIRNIGVTASSTQMSHGSCALAGDGDTEVSRGITSVSNQFTQVSVNALAFSFPLAVRLQVAFNKAELRPTNIKLFTPSNTSIFYEVVVNATITGGTWVPQTESIAEFNVTATAVTGGKVVESGYLSNSTATELTSLFDQFRVSYDTLNNIPNNIIIRVRALSGNGNVVASMVLGESF
jgi:hypothetical protein